MKLAHKPNFLVTGISRQVIDHALSRPVSKSSVTDISLMCGSLGEGMLQRLAKRFGKLHDPVNFVYHYPGYAPVKVSSHDPLQEKFVIQLAERAWEVKLKVDSSTFKLVLSDMVAQQDDQVGYRHKAMHLAREHGDAIVRACSEFCELNLLISLPTVPQ